MGKGSAPEVKGKGGIGEREYLEVSFPIEEAAAAIEGAGAHV